MPASEDRAVRQDSLRDRVLVWRGVDTLESPVTGPQEAVNVHSGLTRLPIRPDDLAAGPDAQSYGENGVGKIDRRESVFAEHEAVGADRVVVVPDDLSPIIDSRCYRSLRAGNFNGSEIKAALDGSESCHRR